MAIDCGTSGARADFPADGPKVNFPEEREGWKGYIEWEKYPEKKAEAAKYLAQYKFPGPPEFQLQQVPDTNPLLEGVRWKQYHYALGDTLKDLPDISWKYVQKEKSEDMIHVLQFPYNGEPPRVSDHPSYLLI
jgi:sulfite oxidase